MNIQAMMTELDIPHAVRDAIIRLTQLKLTATENDLVEKNMQLDRFIGARLDRTTTRPEPSLNQDMIEQADTIFRTYAIETV
jgi:hypothetical protein